MRKDGRADGRTGGRADGRKIIMPSNNSINFFNADLCRKTILKRDRCLVAVSKKKTLGTRTRPVQFLHLV